MAHQFNLDIGRKTEQTNTLVQGTNGANTEVVGGLIYRGFGGNEQMPVFVNVDGRLAASYAEEAFRPDAFYAIHMDSRIDGDHRVARLAPSWDGPQSGLPKKLIFIFAQCSKSSAVK